MNHLSAFSGWQIKAAGSSETLIILHYNNDDNNSNNYYYYYISILGTGISQFVKRLAMS
jgi:hypothetical protein